MLTDSKVGLIIPPPELRNIVDKTASFVARNGPEFESRIQQNEQNNPKFNFLKAGDPYNAYYQYRVKEIREGNLSSENSGNGEPHHSGSSTVSASNQVQAKFKSYVEKIIVPQEPPPDFEFMAEPPSILAQDLDIIKLTAQFVAIHGRSFLTNLMNKEQRNYQFDFLRPQHGLFSYFTQLIEQYTKVFMPPKNLIQDLIKELKDQAVMEKIRYRLEWTKIKEAEKRREQEEIEKERVQYAQIDWHDFVVVETVDYQQNEQGLFPPPTTPEQVGSRILLQQRIEEQNSKLAEADIESNKKEQEEKNKVEEEKAKQAMPPPAPLPPLPTLDNVVIRKDYDPKTAKKQPTSTQSTIKGDGWVISPITNEKIPAEKLAEHMRYGLLDPRWVEQREKAINEKMQQEEVFAPGVAIESSLKQMAERRTDIFGSGIDETEIGKKIGEEEIKKNEKVTWDGYTSSMEAATRAARANITIEDQIQQIHKMKGLVGDDGKDKIGPSILPNQMQMPSLQPNSNFKQNNPIPSQQQRSLLPNHNMNSSIQNQQVRNNHQMIHGQQNVISRHLNSISHHHAMNQHLTSQQFAMPNPMMMGMYPMPVHPNLIPQNNQNMGGVMPNLSFGMSHSNSIEEFEPASKRLRTEDSLMPEEEFLAQHSGSITLNIALPNHPEKPELKLNGQTINMSLSLTDMVSVIKSKINEQIGLAPGKQKLQYDGMFIKDSNTLAYYNMYDGSIIQMALKERGGRKK